MVPDPLVDPITLVTDGGEASRIDLVEKSSPSRPQDLRRRADAELGVEGIRLVGREQQTVQCGLALELAAKEAQGSSASMTTSALCSISGAAGESSPSTTPSSSRWSPPTPYRGV